ncbi:DUF5777 family beta-barrel protein [Flavobacterium franklandianum]|uniref:DUF5777 domain-containing protein n=1 Tax=Flavobacterium franklandianum TaxID=2594430 RepID=A0A553C6Q1_9FLAO|nr:DUF5777 family beta-barrel protein [Flavobacterium franklandianum]TRX16092.1 hypothetical protein FNW17_14980 [Flavobacterium franklandianum]
MNLSKITFSLFFLFWFGFTSAQDDLFKELNSDSIVKKEIATAAFKGLQVCTMQSTKLASKGEWYFLVAHRFGDLTEGFGNFFGFDNALTKIGGLYGVTNWLTLGLSRHTLNKNYELAAKYKFANQEVNGFPVTIVGYNTMDINSNLSEDEFPYLKISNRFAFSTQLPISRKFSNAFSMELNPIYIRKNLYEPRFEKADNFLLALGGRHKISKRISINAEYAFRLNAKETSFYHNPVTVGMDIETGGHVFQLVFSNSQPMNDVSYFTNATGITDGKGIYFGFNLYRVF